MITRIAVLRCLYPGRFFASLHVWFSQLCRWAWGHLEGFLLAPSGGWVSGG